jgi:hypothetical protein
MRDGCVNCDCIDENSTYSLLSGTRDCVLVASPRLTYIIYTGVADGRETGENTIIACGAYAGAATRMGMNMNGKEK